MSILFYYSIACITRTVVFICLFIGDHISFKNSVSSKLVPKLIVRANEKCCKIA